jgi:hypothetical protein
MHAKKKKKLSFFLAFHVHSKLGLCFLRSVNPSAGKLLLPMISENRSCSITRDSVDLFPSPPMNLLVPQQNQVSKFVLDTG